MLEGMTLFWGALLDALIGPNLVVMGEPFFIAAGYQLFSGASSALLLVLVGGYVGDQLSFVLGRHFGKPIQRALLKRMPKLRRSVARSRLLLRKRDWQVIIGARLLGPIAWVMPFIVGTTQVRWTRFAMCSAVGVSIGIGQFVVWGYLLAMGVEQFPMLANAQQFVAEHQMLMWAVLGTGLFLVAARRLNWAAAGAKTVAVAVVALCYINYVHFFHRADDKVQATPTVTVYSAPTVEHISDLGFKVYPGQSNNFDAQAMNIIYVGESPKQLMLDVGWIENKTFSRDDIEFSDYVALLRNNTPPISDLFWNGEPQVLAYQDQGTLKTRSHIRWWPAGLDATSGKPLWVGAISYDDGLSIAMHAGIVTVLHDVDPNVDSERDRFAKLVEQKVPNHSLETVALLDPVAQDDKHEYFSDGGVLVIEQQVNDLAAVIDNIQAQP